MKGPAGQLLIPGTQRSIAVCSSVAESCSAMHRTVQEPILTKSMFGHQAQPSACPCSCNVTTASLTIGCNNAEDCSARHLGRHRAGHA